jgi:endoglucanase
VWTLLNLYERNPTQFPDGSLGIPEAGNKIPDVLDEARWEMDFMLGMQVPESHEQAGMAHHKLHEAVWSPIPFKPSERVSDRFAFTPSTAATLNLAASAAQMARLIKAHDADYSARCLAAAERAWKAAKENPEFKYGRIPGNGGGNYDDFYLEDEYYWAAAELFITTGKAEYKDEIVKALASEKILAASSGANGPMYWGGVATLGHLSLMLEGDGLDAATRGAIEKLVIAGADRYVGQVKEEGYLVPMFEYEWGSNSSVLNKLILMAYAHDATGKKEYLDAITVSADYLLGRNALCKSFVAGYGSNPMHYPHHRFWADEEDAGFPPPPPGALSGGPNEKASDEATAFMVQKTARSKRYADDIRSYSTNEVAINWNAPLAWVASYLDEKNNPDSGLKRVGKGSGLLGGARAVGILAGALALVAAIVGGLALARKRKK